MAIRTFTAQERYSRNKGGVPEPRKKLKKLKSVKVANLDRLRLSMRREKSRFDRSFMVSSDDGTETSWSSSAVVSGTSSPNYMRPTSSSARKGSPQANSGTAFSSSASSNSSSVARGGSAKKSKLYETSKLHKVSVEDEYDLADVNKPVKVIRRQKSIKRVPSVQQAKKLSSIKSMKIRAKYSQFQEYSGNAAFTREGMNSEDKLESSDSNYANDQESMVGTGAKQKSALDGSRSIKMTRLRSKRYSKRLPKSRLSGTTDQMTFGGIPHYMKGTSSHEARQNYAKGLTRTASWKPLRILAKIPSLRQKRSKVWRRPEVHTPLSRSVIGRATSSSTLKQSEFPDHIVLNSGGRESEGTSFVHVCPYNYCSLNGHHHHEPSPPLKEFISAKRQSIKNQKVKKLNEKVEHSTSIPKTDEQSRQMDFTEIHTSQILDPTPEEDEDSGLDFLITIYAKPRKKWASEGDPSNASVGLTSFTYDQTSETGSDWQLAEEAASEISQHKGRQEALNEGLREQHEIFSVCHVDASDKSLQDTSPTTSNDAAEPFVGEKKFHSSGDLTTIFSDKKKYTNIWQLIYQQVVPSNAPKTGTERVSEENEEGEDEDVNACHKGNELDQEQSGYNITLSDEGDNQEVATGNLEFDQTAAVKLVQEALRTILKRHTESVDQQFKPDQDMTNRLNSGYALTSLASEENTNVSDESAGTELSLAADERPKKADRCEGETPRQQMSKSYMKLKKIFVTAKIIKAMERMKKISPRTPRYLPAEPTSEEQKVYLRHLSRNDRKNTEEWMLDYALKRVISRLDPDQQRRVAQLVEAFETVSPEQREGIQDYPMEGKSITTSDSAILVEELEQQRTSIDTIPDQQVNAHQGNEVLFHKSDPEETCLREAHEDQIRATDSPAETSRNNCELVDTHVIDGGMAKASMSILEDRSQSPTRDTEVNHSGDLTSILNNAKNYTCMWNLIYQQVARETSTDSEQGANVLNEDEQGDEATNFQENGPESASTHHKKDEDDQHAPDEVNESDQSAAVKLVKEALDAILTRYEKSSEHQAVPVPQRVSSSNDESSRENGKHVEKQAYPEGEEKLHLRDHASVPRHPGEPKKLESPSRGMSKSYNRLKKAFVTAKFIKAIERLRMNKPRQNLFSEVGSKKERAYLRHVSIDGRKGDEECMLDYALRQVILTMAPDQQRRVVNLVEAFETVTPQQKGKRLNCCPPKIKAETVATSATQTSVSLKTTAETMHQRSIFDEKQDNGVLYERCLQEDQDHQASTAGAIILRKAVETKIPERISEFSQSSLTLAPDVKAEVSSIGVDEITKDAEVSSCFPTKGSEVRSRGDMAAILSDKRKYTSMWNLIHQQVVSSETSKAAEQKSDEVNEEDCEDTNDPDSSQTSWKEKVEKDEDTAHNQSAAIKLVKEAIDAILQRHEQKLDQQALEYDGIAMVRAEELNDTSPSALIERISQEGENEAENHRDPEQEDYLPIVEDTSVPLQEQAEAGEGMTAQKKMSKGKSNLKKLIVTAKFIAAMERLKRIKWRKPQHLSPEEAPQDERVYLRHRSIRGRKNDEQWMLDYALRNVLSSLAPDQQRKVTRIIDAFETVNPELKGNGPKFHKKEEYAPIIESESVEGETESVDLSCETPGSDNTDLHIHRQASPKDSVDFRDDEPLQTSTVRDKNIDANTIGESLQPVTSSENSQQDREQNIAGSIVSDKKKTTSMWQLIFQHTQSVTSAEGGSKLNGEFRNINKDSSQFQIKADANIDDNVNDIDENDDNNDENDDNSDASSVTSELTESDAIKLVKEAINDILEVPQDQDDELLVASNSSSALRKNQLPAGQEPEKSLSRGYRKLRQLIICNKFIKTMQKMRKNRPHKQKNPSFYSSAEAGKARLKSGAAGNKKGSDEWMLDNVLQKVISELAPVQQRRVALLVKAFENVNPGQEERGTVLTYMKKGPSDDIAANANGNEDIVSESSRDSHLSLDGSSPELNKIETVSSMESAFDMVPQDISEDGASSLIEERVPNGEELKGSDPFNITDLPCATGSTSSDTHIDPIGVSCGDEQGDPPHEMKATEKQLVGHHEATKDANQGSLPEGLKDERNRIAQGRKSLKKENYSSLWGLILQHANTDVPQKVEMPSLPEIDKESTTDNSDQLSSEVIHDKGANTSAPTSFDFHDCEAIKLVQEAINELLTVPEQAEDNDARSTSTISEQAGSNHVQGNGRDMPPPDEETTQAEKLMDDIAVQEGEIATPRENVSSAYSKMSQVIMCKRFIKAMDKMRQLRPQPPQENSPTSCTEAEGTPSLRQTSAGEKKSWEEGMLDHALQQVVGKLAPAQKKRVTLLVQAFETVGSQPEPITSWKTKSSNILKT